MPLTFSPGNSENFGPALDLINTNDIEAVSKLGIGKAPSLPLDVNGAAAISTSLAIGKAFTTLALDVVGDTSLSGKLGIGKIATSLALDVLGGAAVSSSLAVGKSTASVALDVLGAAAISSDTTISGKLGVGKTATSQLDVAGDVALTGKIGIGTTVGGGTMVTVDGSLLAGGDVYGIYLGTNLGSTTAMSSLYGLYMGDMGLTIPAGTATEVTAISLRGDTITKSSGGAVSAAYGLKAITPSVGATSGAGIYTDSITIGYNAWTDPVSALGCARIASKLGIGMNPTNALDVTGAATISGKLVVGSNSLSAWILSQITGTLANTGANPSFGLVINPIVGGTATNQNLLGTYMAPRWNTPASFTGAVYGLQIDGNAATIANAGPAPNAAYGLSCTSPAVSAALAVGVYTDSLAVGTGAWTTSALAAGCAKINSKLGIAVSPTYPLDVTGNARIIGGMCIEGVNTGAVPSSTTTLFLGQTAVRTAPTGTGLRGIYNNMYGGAASGQTGVSVFGIDNYVNCNPNDGTIVDYRGYWGHSYFVGTVTNAWQAYFNAPTGAAGVNVAVYTENLVVAANASSATAPPVNGIYSAGGINLGDTTLTKYKATSATVSFTYSGGSTNKTVKYTIIGNAVHMFIPDVYVTSTGAGPIRFVLPTEAKPLAANRCFIPVACYNGGSAPVGTIYINNGDDGSGNIDCYAYPDANLGNYTTGAIGFKPCSFVYLLS